MHAYIELWMHAGSLESTKASSNSSFLSALQTFQVSSPPLFWRANLSLGILF